MIRRRPVKSLPVPKKGGKILARIWLTKKRPGIPPRSAFPEELFIGIEPDSGSEKGEERRVFVLQKNTAAGDDDVWGRAWNSAKHFGLGDAKGRLALSFKDLRDGHFEFLSHHFVGVVPLPLQTLREFAAHR